MSEIHLADDVRIEREVAVKIVSSRHADYIERFRREADTITTLHHPHILPALDYGEYENWHYLVMPYIAYGTLREQLAHGPLTEEHVSIQGERLVLRSNPLDIPAKIPSQRSTRASQAAQVVTPRAAAGVHLQVQTPTRRRRVHYRRRNRVLISMMVVLIMLLLVIVAVLILAILVKG